MKWIGTVMAFIAAMLYASSNVIQEYVTQGEKGYPVGALGAMGFVGSIVALIITQGTQYGQEDRDSVIFNPSPYRWFVSGYVVCMVFFYLGVPIYLQRFSAVRFNFSILTADLFVFIFNKYYLGTRIDGFYIAGFVSVLVGLFVFNLKQPVDLPRDPTDGPTNGQPKLEV